MSQIAVEFNNLLIISGRQYVQPAYRLFTSDSMYLYIMLYEEKFSCVRRFRFFMKYLFVIIMCLAVGGLPVQAQDSNPPPQPALAAIVEEAATADNDPDFTVLYAALQTTELDALLDTVGPLTLFAPTDNAFNTYFDNQDITQAELLDDAVYLERLLLYHMLPGNFLLEHLDDYTGDSIATAYAGTSVTLRFQENSLARLAYVNHSPILAGDAGARNGTIHIIETVLIPPDAGGTRNNLQLLRDDTPPLMQRLQNDGAYEMFLRALDETTLPYDYLDSGLPVTVFAPTDDGFRAYLQEQNTDLPAYIARTRYLTRQMAYHIVPLPFTRDNLLQLDGALLGTYLNGKAVRVQVADGQILIDGVLLQAADTPGSNGFSHELESPLDISPTDIKQGLLPVWGTG
jgi:uncharacterized surface protein with fasciclin (FAS1) repeats